MAQSPLRTWNVLQGGSVAPVCVIALGVVLAALSVVRGGNTAGGQVVSIVQCLVIIAIGLFPLVFVARHVSSDETGCFRFETLAKEVVADPETILAVRRLWFWSLIDWPYPRPVLVTTTTRRILVTQWIERSGELRAALLDANPQMKISPRAFTYDPLTN